MATVGAHSSPEGAWKEWVLLVSVSMLAWKELTWKAQVLLANKICSFQVSSFRQAPSKLMLRPVKPTSSKWPPSKQAPSEWAPTKQVLSKPLVMLTHCWRQNKHWGYLLSGVLKGIPRKIHVRIFVCSSFFYVCTGVWEIQKPNFCLYFLGKYRYWFGLFDFWVQKCGQMAVYSQCSSKAR